jgi:hypothetical protein
MVIVSPSFSTCSICTGSQLRCGENQLVVVRELSARSRYDGLSHVVHRLPLRMQRAKGSGRGCVHPSFAFLNAASLPRRQTSYLARRSGL